MTNEEISIIIEVAKLSVSTDIPKDEVRYSTTIWRVFELGRRVGQLVESKNEE